MKYFTLSKAKRRSALLFGGLAILSAAALGAAYYVGNATVANVANTSSLGQYGVSQTSNDIPVASADRIATAVTADAETNSATKQTVADRALYLIEEEKMAHDVYQKLFELYGARTFSNIMHSELTHESRVLDILQAHGIADPRSEQIGVFQNQDLQKLYDQLIVQGSQSLSEAYKVGVTIEEVDIADLTADLKLVPSDQTDVIDMMNLLKKGSENHLRAFSRHI